MIDIYHHALLTSHRLEADDNAAVGALYDSNKSLISMSQRDIDPSDRWHVADPATTTGVDAVGKYQPRPAQVSGADAFIERAIFGGHLFGPWGHLITESVSTAWASHELPDWPVVFLPWARVMLASLPHRYEVLRLAGWDDRELLILSADCAFSTIYVPERLVRIGQHLCRADPIDNRQNIVYDRMVARTQLRRPTGPVFLARPAGHRRAHPYEAEVAAGLGFDVVRPWTLSLSAQIAAADAASALVGFSGSNLHNSVFAKRGTPVIEIQDLRGQLRPRGLQESLCELRSQPLVGVSSYGSKGPRDAAAITSDISVALAKHRK